MILGRALKAGAENDLATSHAGTTATFHFGSLTRLTLCQSAISTDELDKDEEEAR